MKKVFRYYDNDDDGSISHENIWQAADLLDLEDELNDQNVNMMIEMGDPNNNGFVQEHGFLALMRELGLIFDHSIEIEDNERQFKREREYEMALKK